MGRTGQPGHVYDRPEHGPVPQAEVECAVTTGRHSGDSAVGPAGIDPQGRFGRRYDVTQQMGLDALTDSVHALGVVKPSVTHARHHYDHRMAGGRDPGTGIGRLAAPQPVSRDTG